MLLVVGGSENWTKIRFFSPRDMSQHPARGGRLARRRGVEQPASSLSEKHMASVQGSQVFVLVEKKEARVERHDNLLVMVHVEDEELYFAHGGPFAEENEIDPTKK